MQIGIDSFAAADDDASRAVSQSDRLREAKAGPSEFIEKGMTIKEREL